MNPRIRPYLLSSVDIKNVYTHRDFLKKRPKKVQQFKFSRPLNQYQFSRVNEKQINLKLLKILKLLKPLAKVDLKEFQTERFPSWKAIILSIWKKFSKTKTLYINMEKPEAKSLKKYFTYFPKLEHLNYQISNTLTRIDLYQQLPHEVSKNYLNYLKYSPKIRLLTIQGFSTNNYLTKSDSISKRYFRSLHHLALRSKSFSFDEYIFPVEFCKNLKSVNLQLFGSLPFQGFPPIMNELPKLAHLQEISLIIEDSPISNFITAFQQIAKKGMLTKVSLCFTYNLLNIYEILEVLKLCKLKCFSLITGSEPGIFTSLSSFIQSMNSLETFELEISNPDLQYKIDEIIEMCKQVNKLEKLQCLKLYLQDYAWVSQTQKIQCFIPYFSDLFKKPIKMKTFHLVCKNLPPSESLHSFISILENSAGFLTHLAFDIGTLPETKEAYHSLLLFLKNLSNIQVLNFPCLAVNDCLLLSEIAKALHRCVYLREFSIGEIKETAVTSDICQGLATILSKRGLRNFFCLSPQGSLKKSFEEKQIQRPDWKEVIKRNPHLDTISMIKKLNWIVCEPSQWLKI